MSFTDAIAPTAFNPRAYLEKFGYAAGKGLGKKEDGMIKHIAVNKKEDSAGVSSRRDGMKREAGRDARCESC